MHERLTVVFLGDQQPPNTLILLKRGADRKFTPNRYTGIGGKIEPGEEALPGAIRELREETGIVDVPLVEFGRLLMNGDRPEIEGKVIHYFFGRDDGRELPTSNEGTLERVPLTEIMDRNWIPSTKLFVEQWAKRRWDATRPFTVFMQYDYANNRADDLRVEEKLHMG